MTEIQMTHSLTADDFTERQFDVLCLMGAGKSNKEIADELEISEHTAKFHINAITALMGVDNRTSAVVEALRMGVISLSDVPMAARKDSAEEAVRNA